MNSMKQYSWNREGRAGCGGFKYESAVLLAQAPVFGLNEQFCVLHFSVSSTPWTMTEYYMSKSVLCSVWNLVSIATDVMVDTVRSTLLDRVNFFVAFQGLMS